MCSICKPTCAFWRFGLRVPLCVWLVLTGLGCGPDDLRDDRPLATGLCTSPSGRLLAFDLTRAGSPTGVWVISLSDGKAMVRIWKPHAINVVGWGRSDSSLYVLDEGRIARYELATGRESSVCVRVPENETESVRISDARYIAALDVFVIRALAEKPPEALWVVPAGSGRGTRIATGELVINAANVVMNGQSFVMIASDRFETPRLQMRGAAGRLRLYRYPSASAPLPVRLPVERGIVGRGDITADGAWAVMPFRDYPWDVPISRLYAVDLTRGTVVRQTTCQGAVAVAATGSKGVFLLIGPTTLAIISIEDFQPKALPGGPLGTPTGFTIRGNTEAVIAIDNGCEIWVIDVRTGQRRLLWRPGEADLEPH